MNQSDSIDLLVAPVMEALVTDKHSDSLQRHDQKVVRVQVLCVSREHPQMAQSH